MHGRARPPKGFEPSPEQREKLKKKTQLLKNATTEVLTRVQDRRYDAQTFATSEKLLSLNPEIYTAWNYRKDALSHLFATEEMTDEKKKQMCLKELEVASNGLSSNPKSYGAWQHRRWVVELGLCDVQEEFRFVERKLAEDSRNFHAWNYRIFLVQKSERAPEVELRFSQEMIEQNFSNYSAWHHRSRCLEALHRPIAKISFEELLQQDSAAPEERHSKGWVPLETLKIEFQTVHSAFVTDPDDSSAWIYYRWLMSHFLHLEKNDETEQVLEAEVAFFQSDLIQLDPASKWILLTYALLLEVKNRREGHSSEQTKEIYRKLCEIDPMRRGFYLDVEQDRASILMEIV